MIGNFLCIINNVRRLAGFSASLGRYLTRTENGNDNSKRHPVCLIGNAPKIMLAEYLLRPCIINEYRFYIPWLIDQVKKSIQVVDHIFFTSVG